jgi:hypothetical protein
MGKPTGSRTQGGIAVWKNCGNCAASLEVCEGIYTAEQLAAMHERYQVLHDAWAKIRHLQQEHNSSD